MCITEIPLKRLAMISQYGSQQGDAWNPITRARRRQAEHLLGIIDYLLSEESLEVNPALTLRNGTLN